MSDRLIVFIQIHGEADKLESCLKSLENQSLLPSLVVVVDDGTPNSSVLNAVYSFETNGFRIEYFCGIEDKEPDLDTVGISIGRAYIEFVRNKSCFDYLSIIDVDSLPTVDYYKNIISAMIEKPDLVCASGVIYFDDILENRISAKVIKRTDARGSGKVISVPFLDSIFIFNFPEVAWDTWINVRAILAGKLSLEIDTIRLNTTRKTTRLENRDLFRDGRLTYHFGYNWLLLLYKIITRGRVVWYGYLDARKNKWLLKDSEVRKHFGWRYFLRLLKK